MMIHLKRGLPQAVMIILTIWLCFMESRAGAGRIPDELIRDLQKLNLGKNEYKLGFPLTSAQLKTARENALPQTVEGTFRFKDGDLQVVAETDTNLVILISEYHDNWKKGAIKKLISEFTLEYGLPTTTAHGQTIYWFFSADGELLDEDNYRKYVEMAGKNAVIAAIKLKTSSFLESSKGLGGAAASGTDDARDDQPDSGYYLIYSNPLLELFVIR